jgi:hypothetical protein
MPEQSSASLVAKLRAYWQKLFVRVLVVLLVIGAAIYLQYRLANIAVPVDVEKSSPPYTPAKAALVKNEELVVRSSSFGNASTPVLLMGEGTESVAVEARFDVAQISQDFIDMLHTDPDEKSFPNSDQQPITYTSGPDDSEPEDKNRKPPSTELQTAAPCRTLITIRLADGAKPISELDFFQTDAGSDKHRTFEMKAIGAGVTVQLLTRNFPKDESLGEMQGSDCDKALTIGNWTRSFTAPVPIDVSVKDGESFRFSFTVPEGKNQFTSPGASYEPFKLVAQPLSAKSIETIDREQSNSTKPFQAVAASNGPPLLLKYFRVGSEELQMDYSGQAVVQQNGKYVVTFSVLNFIKDNPVLSGMLAMLNCALLEWMRRSLFRKAAAAAQ